MKRIFFLNFVNKKSFRLDIFKVNATAKISSSTERGECKGKNFIFPLHNARRFLSCTGSLWRNFSFLAWRRKKERFDKQGELQKWIFMLLKGAIEHDASICCWVHLKSSDFILLLTLLNFYRNFLKKKKYFTAQQRLLLALIFKLNWWLYHLCCKKICWRVQASKKN